MAHHWLIWSLTFVTYCTAGSSAIAGETFDVVLRRGKIVDGSGAPWYLADIGISNGKIKAIGAIPPESGKQTIDASGLVVCPGFIDMMGQTATPMMLDPKSAINLLTQGITTINAGEGVSAAPLTEKEGERLGWTTMAEYLALLELSGLPINVSQTVGHTQIRRMVLGDTDRRPNDAELMQMQGHVREAMESGAIGVSTALIYPPAVYATTQEISALTEVAGQFGGKYYTHMRNEGDHLLEAIDEALEIGRSANTAVHIFHLKTAGEQNWDKMPKAIARIRDARANGQQTAADIYPYINNGLGIAALIHPKHFAQGHARLIERLDDAQLRSEIRREMESSDGWENWYRHVGYDWDRIIVGKAGSVRYRSFEGQSIAAIAKSLNEDPWNTFFSLVGSGAFVLPQSMNESNKILAMQQDFVSFCTDVGPAGGDSIASHPRAYGAFPRMLARYVRELGATSLERAISQATAVAANEILAFDRGRIAVGLAADIVVLDFKHIQDNATFVNPTALSTGIQYVLVNGQIVLEGGQLKSALPGRVLRGPGFNVDRAAWAVTSRRSKDGLETFDDMIHGFMREHCVPGMAVAVTNQGVISVAQGYGYADIATREKVTPSHLFRIASISKPITAVTVLHLMEQGKLKLDDKLLDVLPQDDAIKAAGSNFDSRWRDVTIRHLLQHRGGWDRASSFDAMFKSVAFAKEQKVDAPAGPDVVIKSMLSKPMDFDPGEKYAYSNFGYCLLGRVIEHLTNETYEEYVQQAILKPLGIHSMRLGRTRLAERAPGEVRYYQPGRSKSVFETDLGNDIPLPYGAWHLEAMDSHGGWLASAEDLARFAMAFDDPGNCPVLSEKSIALMFERPDGQAGFELDGQPKETYYSLGWMNRTLAGGKMNRWHTGSLDGTATIMIRRHDGRNIIALLNTRASPSSKHLGRDIDQLLHKATDAAFK